MKPPSAHLALPYYRIARILAATGHTDDQIIAFIDQHRTESGYISADLLPGGCPLTRGVFRPVKLETDSTFPSLTA